MLKKEKHTCGRTGESWANGEETKATTNIEDGQKEFHVQGVPPLFGCQIAWGYRKAKLRNLQDRPIKKQVNSGRKTLGPKIR